MASSSDAVQQFICRDRAELAEQIRGVVSRTEAKEFAVRDVVRFQGDINKNLDVAQQVEIYQRGSAAVGQRGMPVASFFGRKPSDIKKGHAEKFRESTIHNTASEVIRTRSAECQSFAQLLGSLLLSELEDPKPRVQLVACRNGLYTHNFVLINCQGDDLSFGALGKQRETLLIGDLWLLALGHNEVGVYDGRGIKIGTSTTMGIYTWNEYPKKNYLKNLMETFDSLHPNSFDEGLGDSTEDLSCGGAYG